MKQLIKINRIPFSSLGFDLKCFNILLYFIIDKLQWSARMWTKKEKKIKLKSYSQNKK